MLLVVGGKKLLDDCRVSLDKGPPEDFQHDEPEKCALVFSSAVQGALLLSRAMGDQALFNSVADEAIDAQA